VASLHNPIGLIPLGTSAFDQCKSAIKFYDYAAIGVPTLCSETPPYSDAVVSGQTGLLVAPSSAAWEAAILNVLDNAELAARLVQGARAAAEQQFSRHVTVQAWRALLMGLGPRRHAAPPAPWWARWADATAGSLREANRRRLERRRSER
jgi:glycosyltransferase involved in cell wall biosynthesis